MLAALLVAASVGTPLPSPELSKERVVGAWSHKWGSMDFARIEFRPDGTYTANYSGCKVDGQWSVERGNRLNLREYETDFSVVFDMRTYWYGMLPGPGY